MDLAQSFSNSLDLAQGFSNNWIRPMAFLIVGFGSMLFWSFCTGHFIMVILDWSFLAGHFGRSLWTVFLDGCLGWSFYKVIFVGHFWSLKIVF